MNKAQIIRLLKVGLIGTIILLLFEVIFSIPLINNFFTNLIFSSSGWVAYIIIWIVMFLQVTIINIPAYSILSACTAIGIKTFHWVFILIVLSAYIAGCILAYWLGRWFGKKAVKWAAGSEEDYDKWSKVLNTKGKVWYFLTILLPLFPDDLLCIVAGAVKFNFVLYLIMNLIGRGIGLITIILVLQVINIVSNGFPFMIIVWALALILEFIAYVIINKKGG